MRIDAVVFDLDGTLIDSRGDIVVAVNHALESSGRLVRPAAEILPLVGDGGRTLCARAAGLEETHPDVDRLFAAFLDHYVAHPVQHTTWMPHALDALDALAPMPIALCTNKPRRTTDAVLAGLGAVRRFACTIAGGDLPEKKPHPRPLLVVAERLGADPRRCAMVGDGPQDIDAGRAAGMRTVGVRGGFLAIERLLAARPDVLLDDLSGLTSIVAGWRA